MFLHHHEHAHCEQIFKIITDPFYAPAPAIAMPGGITFVRPILVNAIYQEHLEGISSNLAQMSTWTEGWTD